jgi:hypothetical protein
MEEGVGALDIGTCDRIVIPLFPLMSCATITQQDIKRCRTPEGCVFIWDEEEYGSDKEKSSDMRQE